MLMRQRRRSFPYGSVADEEAMSAHEFRDDDADP